MLGETFYAVFYENFGESMPRRRRNSKLDANLNIRGPQADYAVLRKFARRNGTTVSELVRPLLTRLVRKLGRSFPVK